MIAVWCGGADAASLVPRVATLALVAVAACGRLDPRGSLSVSATTAFTHVAVRPMDRDTLLRDQTILVRGNRILALGDASTTPIPDGAQVIDGSDRTVIPGLWDMHVHVLGRSQEAIMLPALVAAGVTGVRNMHTVASLKAVHDVEAAIGRGDIVGPRIIANGPLLDGPHPYQHEGSLIVSDSVGARKAVDSLAAAGADFIKVYSGLSREAYFAIAAEATRLRIAFVGHLPAVVTPVEAAIAGQRSVEHLDGLLRDCELSVTTKDEQCRADIQAYRTHHTWQTPTLALHRGWTATDSILADHDAIALIPRKRQAAWRSIAAGTSAAGAEKNRRTLARSKAIVRRLHDAEVPLLAGTDLGNPNIVPGRGLIDELELLTESGLTRYEALQAATVSPARFLNSADSLGTIGKGKIADFILLGGDPQVNLTALRDVRGVMLNGRFHDGNALQRLIAIARLAAEAQ